MGGCAEGHALTGTATSKTTDGFLFSNTMSYLALRLIDVTKVNC